jgi:hypothetical protein
MPGMQAVTPPGVVADVQVHRNGHWDDHTLHERHGPRRTRHSVSWCEK